MQNSKYFLKSGLNFLSVSRKNCVFYILLLMLYLVHYFYSLSHIPELIFPPPGSDAFTFEIFSDVVKQTGLQLKGWPAYFLTPPYIYFCWLIKILTGNNIVHYFKLLIFVQLIIFWISIIYFHLVLQKIFYEAKIFYLLIYALYPVYLFYIVIPVKDILVIALFVMQIYYIIRFFEQNSLLSCMVAGILTGLLSEFRGTFLAMALVILLFFIYYGYKKYIVIFLFSFCLAIVPFFLRNYLIAHELLAYNCVSGFHFYLGNNEHCEPVYLPVKNIRPTPLGHYFDARRVAESTAKTRLTDAEISAFWKKQALDFLVAHPLRAAKLYINKLLLFLNYQEIGNNYDFNFFQKTYWNFHLIGFLPFNFGILLSLGLPGLFLSGMKYRKFFVCLFFVLFLSSLLVFITGRYRLPVTLILILGMINFLRRIKEVCRRQQTVQVGLPCLILMFLSFWPRFDYFEKFTAYAAKKHSYSQKMMKKYRTMPVEKFLVGYNRARLKYLRKYF